MAYKDKNKERESRKRWQQSEQGLASRKKYRELNREKLRFANREYARLHRDKQKIISKNWYESIKQKALERYSGEIPECACCGENFYLFLTVDHINGDGADHRKEIGNSANIYTWLRNNGYPDGFQILCFNCNVAKGSSKVCPCSLQCKGGVCEI